MFYVIVWFLVSLLVLPRFIPSLVTTAFSVNGTPVSWGFALCVGGTLFLLARWLFGSDK